MTPYDILVPFCLMASGIAVAIYSQQVGVAFCQLGKAIWRINSLGLTDMHWFYREKRAPRTMKLMGVVLCVIGLVLALLSYVSLHGPNAFAAMRQADDYLINVYGKTDGETSFSCKTSGANDVIVQYHYGDRKGNLRAFWDGHKYSFTQVP